MDGEDTDITDAGITGAGDDTGVDPSTTGEAGSGGADSGSAAEDFLHRALAFERRWSTIVRRGPRQAGRREEAIRTEFGMSAVRYHQRLNLLLDTPVAEAADPVTVHRLQRLRDGSS
ncbi:DUF3263 domain-containing protein [Corynebacterium freneyi]|uniref:DUF3263 domain-containing protein n=1 Tax=Corynebacterium freneyi TaxID=134034 RepID=UPI00254A53EF|nr:DUF3263 domain-containing protein [Corynebacterium freneyi]MDK8767479.1 DUF3263 domain-containing protein [Corynebacterium freneyi]